MHPAAGGAPDTALVRAYIAVGANLGDSVATVRWALAQLALLPATRVAAASALYRSAPVDATGPDYVNAVAAVDTGLPALQLLDALFALERERGRERAYRNAPRTLDLDLLLYGDAVVHDDRLTLPHPRMHQRAFVLRPLADIAPLDLMLPGLGRLADWLPAVAGQALARLD